MTRFTNYTQIRKSMFTSKPLKRIRNCHCQLFTEAPEWQKSLRRCLSIPPSSSPLGARGPSSDCARLQLLISNRNHITHTCFIICAQCARGVSRCSCWKCIDLRIIYWVKGSRTPVEIDSDYSILPESVV